MTTPPSATPQPQLGGGDDSFGGSSVDEVLMDVAIAMGWRARHRVSPRPWVGAVVVPDGFTGQQSELSVGATEGRHGPHAEVVALAAAGDKARGGTLYCTLEPCSHHGVTPPCAQAIVDAGIDRVVVAVADPDERVAGQGIEFLRSHGVTVDVGVRQADVAVQLEPYLHHRRTGRPYVVLKLAATADGRTAAPDGTSQWITSAEARADAHALRADSDAVLVGAGTVRVDNPALTVRLPGWEDVTDDINAEGLRQPLRVVLGAASPDRAIQPCVQSSGDPAEVLADLGQRGVLQLLVEGGASVARSLHGAGLVDRYVIYVAPAFAGGSDAPGLFSGQGAATLDGFWRGQIAAIRQVGADVRLDLLPRHA